MTEPRGKLAAVSGKDVSIDPAEHYDAWAEDYETDLLETYRYCAHSIAAAALDAALPDRAARIIDIGCGTGLVGAELHALGFREIDGVDISNRMLGKARARGLYRALFLQDAEKASVLPSVAYDAVISVGSFGIGHLGPEAMPRLVAHARPGGLIVIFMNAEPFIDQGYAGHIARMAADELWVVERIEDHNYMAALDRPGKLILARRAGA
ncbi:MAG: methyltransferase domain-containing protein [Pseudomonadota bacterium]